LVTCKNPAFHNPHSKEPTNPLKNAEIAKKLNQNNVPASIPNHLLQPCPSMNGMTPTKQTMTSSFSMVYKRLYIKNEIAPNIAMVGHI
jgi:hypothetical protein